MLSIWLTKGNTTYMLDVCVCENESRPLQVQALQSHAQSQSDTKETELINTINKQQTK